MSNWKRLPDGSYISNGKKFSMLIGSPRQVWNGTALKTGYGKRSMTKRKLFRKKDGRIVSKARSMTAKKNKNLGRYIGMAKKNKGKRGFTPMKKGMFGKTKKRNAGGVSKTHKKRKCRNGRGKYKKC